MNSMINGSITVTGIEADPADIEGLSVLADALLECDKVDPERAAILRSYVLLRMWNISSAPKGKKGNHDED